MSKIDIDKLVVYLMKYTNMDTFQALRNAIKAQGLDFDFQNEVLFTPFIIKKGNYTYIFFKPIQTQF